MKNILHFSVHNHVKAGIRNQLSDELASLSSAELQDAWTIKLFTHSMIDADYCLSIPEYRPAVVFKYLNYIRLRRKAYEWLKENENLFDAIVLRYNSADVFQYQSVEYLSKYFTIHHTMEKEEAQTRPHIYGIVEPLLERLSARKVLEGAAGIIGVTPEIVDYELSRISSDKPSYCHPNGVSYNQCELANDCRKGKLKLLFVASVDAPWHGLDVLLEKMSNVDEEYELHIVGATKMDQKYRDPRFVYHGQQDRSYIANLEALCDLGLSSFALYRKGMTQACTLKVRDHLAKGIPVYSGHTDSGLPSDFPYYVEGAADPEKILDCARNFRNVERSTVRDEARQYIDKEILLKKLHAWLSEHC